MPTPAGEPRSAQTKLANRIIRVCVIPHKHQGKLCQVAALCAAQAKDEPMLSPAPPTYPSAYVTTFRASLVPLSPLPPPTHLPTKSPCRLGSLSHPPSSSLLHHYSFFSCEPVWLDSNLCSTLTQWYVTLASYLISLCLSFLTSKIKIIRTHLTAVLWGQNLLVSIKHSE